MQVIKSADTYKKTSRLNHTITLTCNNGECYIDTPIGVSGIQINFQGKVDITPNLPNDFIMQGNTSKILIFTLGKNKLSSGLIFTYFGDIEVLEFIACDEKGQRLIEVFQNSEPSWSNLEFEHDKQDNLWNNIKNNRRNSIVNQTNYNLPDYGLPKVEKVQSKKTVQRTTQPRKTIASSSPRRSGGY